jgi:hypothetical protein
MMSLVRVWNPATQSRFRVCRQCCKDLVELLGQSIKHAQVLEWPQLRRRFPPVSWPFRFSRPEWMQRLGRWLRKTVQNG